MAEFVQMKSIEFKSRLDAILLSNIVKGSFKAYITFDCSHNPNHVIAKLEKRCENTKYKIIFIEFDKHHENDQVQEQLMVSSHYDGEYPSIVKQIEDEISQYFQNFNIIRIQIKASLPNENIPQNDVEKKFFWNDKTNYFEFRYDIEVRKNHKQDELRSIVETIRRYSKDNLRLSHDAFQGKHLLYVLTMRLFDFGRENAFKRHNLIMNHLKQYDFLPAKVVHEFVVYDTHTELDEE